LATLFHATDVHCIAWHPSGEELTSGDLEGVYAWQGKASNKRTRVEQCQVEAMDWLKDGKHLVFSDSVGTVHVFTRDRRRVGAHKLRGCVFGLVALDDMQCVAVASEFASRVYKVYVVTKTMEVTQVLTHDGYNARTSPLFAGRWMVIGASGSDHCLVDCQNWVVEQTLARKNETSGWCRCVVLDDDHVVGGDSKDVVVWKRHDGTELLRQTGAHKDIVYGVTPFPGCIVTYSKDKAFTAWDWKKPAKLVKVDPKHLEPNQVVGEQYCVESCIGQGESSVLYRATDQDTRQSVALKFYQDYDSFRREIRFLNKFNDPVSRMLPCDVGVEHCPTDRFL
jgi:hypothetical protein